jgi:copper chaperone CopZ
MNNPKTTKSLMVIVSAIFTIVLCFAAMTGQETNAFSGGAGIQAIEITEEAEVQTETVELKVTGMHCGRCSARLSKAFTNLEGVTENDVSFSEKKAVVTYNPEKVTPEELLETVTKTGFSGEIIEEVEEDN